MVGRLNIPNSRPVPKEDIERFKKAMDRGHQRIDERRRKAYARAAAWERYMLENDPPR